MVTRDGSVIKSNAAHNLEILSFDNCARGPAYVSGESPDPFGGASGAGGQAAARPGHWEKALDRPPTIEGFLVFTGRPSSASFPPQSIAKARMPY